MGKGDHNLATGCYEQGLLVGNYIDGDFLKWRYILLIDAEKCPSPSMVDAFIENAGGDRISSGTRAVPTGVLNTTVCPGIRACIGIRGNRGNDTARIFDKNLIYGTIEMMVAGTGKGSRYDSKFVCLNSTGIHRVNTTGFSK